MRSLRSISQILLQRVEGIFNAAFGNAWNPWYHLGGLTIFFFWVVLVSGLYVFVLFETSIFGAYQSVEYMTHTQWYLGGVMRSLHRYASDAAVITILAHIVKEFVGGRYRGARWFSWFTGVPLLWMVFPLGISGYWLVWDELAQYVAIATSEFLDWLPIFTDPMARNFLTEASLSDRFFTLLAFLHLVGIPIFLVFGIWFHLLRISRPKVNPPRGLAVGSLAALVLLSLVKPAVSHAPADLATVPTTLHIDWYYLLPYPVLDMTSPAMVWALLVGSSVLLSLAPWLPPVRQVPAAKVDPANCNGCARCYADCPFGAVTMLPREDGSPHKEIATVNPALCTSCGICAGACPSATPFRTVRELVSGIDMPDRPVQALREAAARALDTLPGPTKILVCGCSHAVDVETLGLPGVAALNLPCTGNLPPAFIDYALRRKNATGVVLTGCRPGDCYYRLGNQWVEERVARERNPKLRASVDRRRLRVAWAAASERDILIRAIQGFETELKQMEAAVHTLAPTQPTGVGPTVQRKAVGHD